MYPKKIKIQKIVINSNATNWLVRNLNYSLNSNYRCRSKGFSNNAKKVGSWIGSVKRYVSNVQNEVTSIEDDAKKIYENPEDKKNQKSDVGKKKMSNKETGFISHLTELRQRLINSFIFLGILFILCYIFSDHIYGFLVEPYANAVKRRWRRKKIIFTALQETFLTYLKVSFFATFFATRSVYSHTSLEIYCARPL